jgi:hypothetical protein
MPIASREFLAVEKALHDNKWLIAAKNVLWEVDSKTVQLYWRNQGGVTNVWLCRRVVDLILWCQSQQTLVVTKWVRSEENLYPDLLSRDRLMPDWHLCPRVISLIFKRLGTPLIDLMATSRSTQLPQYYSIHRADTGALQMDAMAQDWDMFRSNYIFPPEPILPMILQKIACCSRETTFILVTPYWRSRLWFPRLLAMSPDLPLRLPLRENLVVELATGQPPMVRNILRLVVWTLTGQDVAPPMFPLGLGDSLTKAGRRELRQRMAQLGESGLATVSPTPWTRLTPLFRTC